MRFYGATNKSAKVVQRERDLPHSFEERLRGKDSLLCGLVQSRSTSGCAFSEDGVRREEARISTGVASELSELGGSIRSPTGDVNSSLNASRAHAVAILTERYAGRAIAARHRPLAAGFR